MQISEIDVHLNEIVRRTNFGSFISVKMMNIHQRPVQSANSSDADKTAVDSDVHVPNLEDVDLGEYPVHVAGQ